MARDGGTVFLIYIDDGISGSRDFIAAKAASYIQRNDLIQSGLKTNEKKSHWDPMQVGQWLGFIINTITMTFHVPQRKIDKLHSLINTMLTSSEIVVKDLARVAGQIASMTLGLGPIARLFTRQMYFRIENRQHWHQTIVVDNPLLEELKFWLQHVHAFNGYAISRTLSATSIVYSDASSTGYGGYSVQLGNFHSSAGLWSREESTLSSTYREMKAILNVLKSFKNSLQNQAIIWFTDSANATRIVRYGSSKPHLHAIAVQIFDLCLDLHIDLNIDWLPRSENQKADYYYYYN